MLTKEAEALNEKQMRHELLKKLQNLWSEYEDAGLSQPQIIGVAEYAVRQYEGYHFGIAFAASMKKTEEEAKEKGQE